MTIYSKQFFCGVLSPVTDTLLHTPAPGVVTVVRSITVVPFSSGSFVSIRVHSGSVGLLVVSASVALTSYSWDGRQVLNIGDLLYGFTTDPIEATVIVSGYELN